MENKTSGPENSGMEKELNEHLEIIDRATELAFEAFDLPTDEHIVCVAQRLEWNYAHGLGDAGATTLH